MKVILVLVALVSLCLATLSYSSFETKYDDSTELKDVVFLNDYEDANSLTFDEDEELLSTVQTQNYITDMMVVEGKHAPCPQGFDKLSGDLNEGAGGAYLYFCAKRGGDLSPLTNIMIVDKRGATCPAGYELHNTDLNKKAGGDYLYFCSSRQRGAPISDIMFVKGRNSFSQCPILGYEPNTRDLNDGAGGAYIYMCLKKDGKVVRKTFIDNFTYDLSSLKTKQEGIQTVTEMIVTASRKAVSQKRSGKLQVKVTRSWANVEGVDIEIDTSFPVMSGTRVVLGPKSRFNYTTGSTLEQNNEQSYSVTCTAQPNTTKKCAIIYREVLVSIPFTARRTNNLWDGTNVVETISGTFEGIIARPVEVQEQITN